MNKLKYIRIQNKDSSYGERFPIAVDGENVFMEEGINLQTQVQNLHQQIADAMRHNGIYVGNDEPDSDNVSIWIDTDAQSDPPIVNAMPIPVSTAAQMVDPTKIYLYTGQESGYLYGYWYYYNGYMWAFGGAYGTAITDNTLTQTGVPADAKAVGDSIAAHSVSISISNDNLIITTAGGS